MLPVKLEQELISNNRLQQRQYILFLVIISPQTTTMQSCSILQIFNNYTFNSSAQSMLSSLNQEDLENLLEAIVIDPKYQQLAQLVRSRIVLGLAEKVDRSYYFTHYDSLDCGSFREERTAMLASHTQSLQLKLVLDQYQRVVQQARSIFEEDFQEIVSAIFEPDLQLPPVRRETVAPNCQTVYQIILAFRKLNISTQQESLLPPNHKTTSFFFQCLQLQIRIADIYLNALTDGYEHFSQITYRFMLYRNTVLTLHNLCPFPVLSQTMSLWNSIMRKHYQRSHLIFVNILGLDDSMAKGHSLITADELKLQGYLIDYIQGLVDQSIDEQTVAFCGHSKQCFGGQYAMLQTELLSSLTQRMSGLQVRPSNEDLDTKIAEWSEYGVKPSTLLKMCLQLKELQESWVVKDSVCCREDAFIETCARINGLTMPDPKNLNIWCC